MRCCALTPAPGLRLLYRNQISGGGIGPREVNEVATEVGVEAGLSVVTLLGACRRDLERPMRRRCIP
jgi:hypothetical protein